MATTITPTELAVQIWGKSENWSRSQGARKVRTVARELFSHEAPGKGGEWHLTSEQAAEIRKNL